MKKILCAIGTRPEAIKMAPVVLALKSCDWAEVILLTTGQHRDMVDQILPTFGIVPDIDLDVMTPNQDLASLTARVLQRSAEVIRSEVPDAVLVQGDTTSVMALALAAFYERTPLGHVEAGLRTGNLLNPFPEEMNRVVTARLATWHFAPTQSARQNLLREGVQGDAILVTGNTVVDTLLHESTRQRGGSLRLDAEKKLVMVTVHRRENFGPPMTNIMHAIRDLALIFPEVEFVFPVHPNPNVRNLAHQSLAGVSNIQLCEPLDYFTFVNTMRLAFLVVSDSGGVQEEAPALGVPVLVLRNETERPEAVEMGLARLVGSDRDTIVREVSVLLTDRQARASMIKGVSPYGDGHASERIVGKLEADLAS